jgi:hypothetical protein
MSYEELGRDISDMIDGVATPRQAERLQRAISGDPEAAELFRQMRELDTVLRDSPSERAPADLKAAVLESVEALRRPRPAADGWFATLVASFSRRPKLGFACAFSAGLGTGVLLLVLATRGPWPDLQNHERTSGTMINQPAINQSPPGGDRSATLNVREHRVTLTTPQGGAGDDVRLEVEGQGPIAITLRGVAPTDSVVRLEVEAAGELRQKDVEWNPRGGN